MAWNRCSDFNCCCVGDSHWTENSTNRTLGNVSIIEAFDVAPRGGEREREQDISSAVDDTPVDIIATSVKNHRRSTLSYFWPQFAGERRKSLPFSLSTDTPWAGLMTTFAMVPVYYAAELSQRHSPNHNCKPGTMMRFLQCGASV